MSEERLQEIKDSVNFQREFLLVHNMGTLCVDEEQELIEEIERLNNNIQELKERSLRYSKQIDELLDIKEEIREKLQNVQITGLRSGKTLISTLLNDILEILDKESVE